MKTGKQVIYDEELGETQNWFFNTSGSKKGQGCHGIKDGVLYIKACARMPRRTCALSPWSLRASGIL